MKENTLDIALITSDQLATYGEIAGMYGRGKEARKIPLENVYERAGFNHRHTLGDLQPLMDFLLGGGDVPPIEVDILKDGKAIILAGHRRAAAHRKLVEAGHDQFKIIHAFVNPRTLSEQERVIRSVSSNNLKNFEPLEQAEAFNDLRVQYGMSNADIARSCGYSTMHVSNQLRLAGVTDEEKDLIRSGAVSSTAVIDLIKTGIAPGARLDTIKEAASGGGDGEKKGKLKIKDVEVMGDLKAGELKDTDTPDSLIKGIIVHVKALDRLIGTDSKMSDITFKIDAELRVLKTLIAKNYKLNNAIETNHEYWKNVVNGAVPQTPNLDHLFKASAETLIIRNFTGSGLLNHLYDLGPERAKKIVQQLQMFGILSTSVNGAECHRLFDTLDALEIHLKKLNLILDDDDQPF